MANIDPSLFSLLKTNSPGKSDSDILSAYEQIKTDSLAAGTDLDKVPPQQQAAMFKQIFDAAKQPQALEPVSITSQKPAGVLPPVASAQDALYQGNGPTAQRLNTSNPDLLKQAQDKLYAQSGGNNQLYRGMSDFSAAVRGGIGGQAGAVEANAKRWNDLDTANTTGNVKAQQELADKGLTGANSALSTASSVANQTGELDMKKRAFVLDQQLKGLSVEQANTKWDSEKDLYNPESAQTKAVIGLAEPFLKSIGIDTTHLKGLSGSAIQEVIAKNQAAFDEWAKKANIDTANYNALTGRITGNASAGQAAATTAQTQLGTKLLSSATDNGTKVPGGMNLSLSAPGASITPSPATTGAQTGAIGAINDLRTKTLSYDTGGVGRSIDSVLSKLPNAGILSTGVIGDKLKLIPGEAQALKSGLNAYYISKGMDPSTAEKQADELFKLKPSEAVKRLAMIKADQQVGKITLGAMEKFANENNGQLTGFKSPPVTPYYNPKSGQVKVTDDAKTDDADLRKAGYLPVGAQ